MSCIEFKGYIDRAGYGRIGKRLAHRIVAEKHFGSIVGKVVMHICDNRRCVNPKHLRVGTQKDNVQDMFKKGRSPSQSSHCKRGHPRTPENTYTWRQKKKCLICQKYRDSKEYRERRRH